MNTSELKELALLIKQETVEEANSSLRIGTAFEEVVKKLELNEDEMSNIVAPILNQIEDANTAVELPTKFPSAVYGDASKVLADGIIRSYNGGEWKSTGQEVFPQDVISKSDFIVASFNKDILTRNGKLINPDGTLNDGWFGTYAASSEILELSKENEISKIKLTTDYIDHNSVIPCLFLYDGNKQLISSHGAIGLNDIAVEVTSDVVYYAVQDQSQAHPGEFPLFSVTLSTNPLRINTKKYDGERLISNTVDSNKLTDFAIENYPFDLTATLGEDLKKVFKYLKLSNADISKEYYISRAGKGQLNDNINARTITIKDSDNNIIASCGDISDNVSDTAVFQEGKTEYNGVVFEYGFYPNFLQDAENFDFEETQLSKLCVSGRDHSVLDYTRFLPLTENSYANARKVIKSVKLFNVDETHKYCFSQIYVNYHPSNYQIVVNIQDSNNGFASVMNGTIVSETPFSGVVRMKIDGRSYGNYSNAEILFDIPENTTFTDYSNKAYIHQSCIKTPDFELVLPSKYPVVVGKTAYVYYENFIKNAYQKEIGITCYGGTYPNKDYVKLVPSTVGTDNVSFIIQKNGRVVTAKSLPIIKVAANAGSGANKKVLVIGDSKTDNPAKLIELQSLFSFDVMDITLIGTQDTPTAPNEGYSGRNVIEFTTDATLNGLINPFYNPATSLFDFAYYMTQNGFGGCDILFIDHGANQAGIGYESVKAAYDKIISSAKAYNSNINIVISLQEGSCLMEQIDFVNRNNKYYLEQKMSQMIADFDGRENENIFVCAQYLNVDLLNDFTIVQEAASIRNSTLVNKCSDTVHPANAGYWKIADCYFNVIKYITSL